MSWTTAARLSRAQCNVAIFVGEEPSHISNVVGIALARVLLSRGYSCFFPRVVYFLNEPDEIISGLGAEVRALSPSTRDLHHIEEALYGVNVLVDLSLGRAGASRRVLDACISVGVSVYFYLTYASSVLELSAARETSKLFRQTTQEAFSQSTKASKTQAVVVDVGCLMEEVESSITTTSAGHSHLSALADTPSSSGQTGAVACTATNDVATTLAELSILAMSSRSRVPDHVQIAGDVYAPGPKAVRSDNELVNPAERIWKWTKLRDP
ncbi:hypothetical protein DENSPDRAFT_631492 [Dentipellis sp. KUC8613]|nr:hypothetical protein DENSPDRAFT_631492 [Dentipellis sp. KUC8613]